jgi:hypothetical protein
MNSEIKKIWQRLKGLVSFVAVVFGIYKIFDQQSLQTYSGEISLIVVACFIWLAGPTIISFIKPALFKQFKIPFNPETIINTYRHTRVKIQKDGTADVEIKKYLVAIDDYKKNDLRDLFSMARYKEINDVPYISRDAVEISRKYLTGNKMVITWKPKKVMHLFCEYLHTFEWKIPSSFNYPANYYEFYSDMNIGKHKIIIHSKKPILKSMVYLQPKYFPPKTGEERCLRWFRNVLNNDCPIPKRINAKTIEWEINNPQIGRTYTILFFHKRGYNYWKRMAGKESWWTRSLNNTLMKF